MRTTRTRIGSAATPATVAALAAAVLGSGGATAHAQVAARSTLTLDGARAVIAAAMAHAEAIDAPGGVIAVVDGGGHLMALERIDGTFPAGAEISIGKARTAVLFRRPTKVFEDVINKGRTAMTALPPFFTPLQGGIPIEAGGAIVGGVGVSGAASAPQDEEIALAGAEAAKTFGAAASATPTVRYFAKDAVAAAFAKGAVLVDGAGGRHYMVHASRRDKPGLAEVHTRDTDVIYVLAGGATLVTGGAVVEGETVEPGEIRGRAIAGGESRRLEAGDVVVVPNGTPHWFREVPRSLEYFVVKAR